MAYQNALAEWPVGGSEDCIDCGFGLWLPILGMTESSIGLYSDARFPGRCILSMRNHFDHITDVPPLSLMTFMEELQFSVDAIKAATGAKRVNVAILGNAESHVHAHLIPRRPEDEPKPKKAPWEDTRVKDKLPIAQESSLVTAIRDALEISLAASAKPVRAPLNRPSSRTSTSRNANITLFDLLAEH